MRYEFGIQKKEFMALVIGTHNNKTILLDDKFVDQRDADLIRSNIEKLSEYTLYNKVKWIRENCPNAYKGYKEIYTARLKQEEVYIIK